MRLMTRLNTTCASLLVLAAAAGAPPAEAAGASSDVESTFRIDEIVVKAQKREQNLQDVGIAISVVAGDDLRNLGITQSEDIARIAPNVNLASAGFGGQQNQFGIRGITQNDFNDHVETGVAIYIDDAYVAMQQGQSFSMFDVDRVEILKGPQGTLFGRNAIAGLVHTYTKRPTAELEGYVDLSYGRYDDVRVEAGISGPISEKVRARVSGFFNRHDGTVKNVFPEETFAPSPEAEQNLTGPGGRVLLPGAGADLGGLDSNWAARAQFEVDLSDKTQLWISAYGSESKQPSPAYYSTPALPILDANGVQINTIHASPTETCETIQVGQCVNGLFDADLDAVRPVAGTDWFGILNPHSRKDRIVSIDGAFSDKDTVKTYGATAKFTIDLDSFTITSITDYKDFSKFFTLDLDQTAASQFFWISLADEQTFSQELQIAGSADNIDWIAGLYYLNMNAKPTINFSAASDSIFPFSNFDQNRFGHLKTDSYSAFGQVEYAFDNNFKLIVGGRLAREVKDYDYETTFVIPNANPFALDLEPTIPVPGFFQSLSSFHKAETLWSGKVQLEWTPNENFLVYGGVSRGVKASNFNLVSPPVAIEDIPYDDETLVSYEIGFKSTVLDGRALFNASAFYYDYSDYQASRWLGISATIVNADMKTYGVEADLQVAVTKDLKIVLNAGYTDAEVKDLLVGTTLRDVDPVFSPDFSAFAMLQYQWPAEVLGGFITVQLDGSYQSSQFQNLSNFDNTRLSGYALANARMSWASYEKGLRVDVSVTNLTNKDYAQVGYDTSQTCGCTLTNFGDPRWWHVSVRYDF